MFWRGFAARSSTHTARDGGRNRAFSSASSVLSSNKSASSSSEGETDDDSDDENENDSEREKKKSKNEDYSCEKKEHPKHPPLPL